MQLQRGSMPMSPVPTLSESPLRKSGFSCKTECSSTAEGLVWIHRSTDPQRGADPQCVQAGLVLPRENGGCNNTTCSLKRSQSELC